jgi:sugar phosphate isomerase/epimerase
MQIGFMNNPASDAVAEVRWAAEHDFDFVDLTIEAPAATVERLDVAQLKAVLDETGLGIVGHTAWYLPFGSPVPQVRAGAIEAIRTTFEPFAYLGASYVTVHVDSGISHFADHTLDWNVESFARLAEHARPYGLTIMIENVPGTFNTPRALRTLLAAHPDLRFHLDIGHANIKGERTADYLKILANKLVHVHLSDNRRANDDHLPLGVGSIDWPEQLRLLKAVGYDGTITLEVFTPDRQFVLDSAARLRRRWNEL